MSTNASACAICDTQNPRGPGNWCPGDGSNVDCGGQDSITQPTDPDPPDDYDPCVYDCEPSFCGQYPNDPSCTFSGGDAFFVPSFDSVEDNVIYVGEQLNLTLSIENQGDEYDCTDAELDRNGSTVRTFSSFCLNPGQKESRQFTWVPGSSETGLRSSVVMDTFS